MSVMSAEYARFVRNLCDLTDYELRSLRDDVERECGVRVKHYSTNSNFLNRVSSVEPDGKNEVSEKNFVTVGPPKTEYELVHDVFKKYKWEDRGYRFKEIAKVVGSEVRVGNKAYTLLEALEELKAGGAAESGNGYWRINV